MQLIDAIRTHALTEAQAGDWQAVAAIVQAISETAPDRLCYAVESGDAAVAAGGNHTELLAVLQSDPNGQMLFQKLASSAGVMWAHRVTVPYLAWLVSEGKMSQAVMDALIQLSAPASYAFASETASTCETAYKSAAITARIKNASALASERISHTDTSEQAAAKWATAWAEAV